MIFESPNRLERPVRLSEETRAFAYDSLHHRYGLDTRKTPAVSLDDIPTERFHKMSELAQYDLAVERIAREAPIRVCRGERISGAATLGIAIDHRVPATYAGQPVFRSVSHLTVDFETVLKKGIQHIRQNVEDSLAKHPEKGEKRDFLQSCVKCLDAMSVFHERYLDALRGKPEYAANYRNLLRVPMEPATGFYEAVQSLWFSFAFLRLCGNWPGIGRIDVLLGDYLKRDLEAGTLTLDEAREILAHFFIKGCEWIVGGNYVSGDAQHYQNILIGGVDAQGRDVTNEVSYLVLDILEELGISDFPTSVRLNPRTDPRFLRRVAEVMRYGGGMLAVYNEDLVMKALQQDGYSEAEAANFANDGCWEVQIPGKTFFNYVPFDSLWVLQEKTLGGYRSPVEASDFETLYARYRSDLEAAVRDVAAKRACKCDRRDAEGNWEWVKATPCTAVSLFEKGCVEKAQSYLEGGPVYNLISRHLASLADAVNSLYAIRKLVYEERRLTLPEFCEILKKNWEGEEALRESVKTRYAYYGNDNDEVDALAARLLKDFAKICRSLDGCCGYRFPAGVSTFGRQIEWLPHRLAAPHGRCCGEVLAGNSSPTPGTDREGVTAVIRSYCKADLSLLATGCALDVKLLPSAVKGEDGLQALEALLRGFVALNGFFMQLDVADASLLKEAQEHPEQYQTLSVRVSGWNARFVSLSREWQNMIIEQTER